jgi:hypothetical protein
MNNYEMHRIAVGEKYPAMSDINSDGAVLELCRKSIQPTLLVGLSNIRDVELDAFNSENPIRVGLFNPDEKTIFVIFRFGNVLELDAPFNVGAIDPDDLEILKLAHSETRILLSIILVERTTDIVKNLRVCTFSPFFTRQLTSAIRRQMKYFDPVIKAAHKQAVEKYSVTDMVKSVQFHKCGI